MNIILLIIKSSFCVAVYVTYSVFFLIVTAGSLSAKYDTVFNNISELLLKLIALIDCVPVEALIVICESETNKLSANIISLDSLSSPNVFVSSSPIGNVPVSSPSCADVFVILYSIV